MGRLIWVKIGPTKGDARCLVVDQQQNRLRPPACPAPYNGLGDARSAESFEVVGSVVSGGIRVTAGQF